MISTEILFSIFRSEQQPPRTDCWHYYAPHLIGGGIKRFFCLTSDVCLSVAYIGRNSRIERLRKTKIGTEVVHVTRDLDTTFKVKRSPGRFGWLFKSLYNLYGLRHNLRHHPERATACRSWIFVAQGALGAAGVRRLWAAAGLHRAAYRGGGILRGFSYSLFSLGQFSLPALRTLQSHRSKHELAIDTRQTVITTVKWKGVSLSKKQTRLTTVSGNVGSR